MPASPSTPRIRLTQALYLGMLACVALSDGRWMSGLSGIIAQAAGFALVMLAVLGRVWTSLFIAGIKDEQLVRAGPFAACRHPLYLGSFFGAIGLGLATRSAVLSLLLPFSIGLMAVLAARREDAFLAARHGAAWQAYRDEVPAFWPDWSRLGYPDTVSVLVPIYLKAFKDAASFLGVWLLVVLLDALRVAGAWPALFRMP